MNILLIEDNQLFREILHQQLSTKDCHVFAANNGLEGLKILEHESIDLVLTDVQMPIMSGYEFLVTARTKYRFN